MVKQINQKPDIQQSTHAETEFPWWAPRSWSIAFKLLVGAFIFVLTGLIYVRLLDRDYDDPSKYEQVYYLNNTFTLPHDAVKITFNLFGGNKEKNTTLKAKLISITSDKVSTSLDRLAQNFIIFNPQEIKPEQIEVTIQPVDGNLKLKDVFARMAQKNLINIKPGNGWHGPIYSFDLVEHSYRGENHEKTLLETFHFREDGSLERLFLGLGAVLIIISILAIIEFKGMINRARKKNTYGSLVRALRWVLKQIDKIISYFDLPLGEWSQYQAPAKIIIRSFFEMVDHFLEKEEQRIDTATKRANVSYQISQLKLSFDNETAFQTQDEFRAALIRWQHQLQNFLKQLKPHDVKALAPHEYENEIRRLNQEMLKIYEEMKKTVRNVNTNREKKHELHLGDQEAARQQITKGITEFLHQKSTRQDLEQLSKTFPLDTDMRRIFKIENHFADGKITSMNGETWLFFPFISFPIPNDAAGTENPIFFEIVRENSQYYVTHPKHHKPHQEKGSVLIPAILEVEKLIRYQIDFTEPIEFADPSKLKITENQIELNNPDPDPNEYFTPFEVPEPPDLVKV